MLHLAELQLAEKDEFVDSCHLVAEQQTRINGYGYGCGLERWFCWTISV